MEETVKKPVKATTKELEASVDQLKNYCDQLLSQRNQLAQQLNGIQNILNKLPYLFKVLEHADKFNPNFVQMCTEEIEAIMTPQEAEATDAPDNKKS